MTCMYCTRQASIEIFHTVSGNLHELIKQLLNWLPKNLQYFENFVHLYDISLFLLHDIL